MCKTLEEHLEKVHLDSHRMQATYIMVDLAEDEDVDMSVTPSGKSNNNWTFEKDDSLLKLPVSGNKLLD
jgi:hypothetical protein